MPESQGSTILPTTPSAPARGIWPLQSLNFFMADMQAGIGPFLGIFLLAHHWQSGLIGTVMTAGGVAGMLVTAPAGDLIDNTAHKRGYVITSGLPTGLIGATVVQTANTSTHVTSAILIGVDIGPNLSVTGSLATILWLMALRREGITVGAGAFLKLGLVVMPPALLLALGGSLL